MSIDETIVEVLQLDKEATPGPWKEDIGIYESPNDYNDLAFARGPMIERKRGEMLDAFRTRALPNARLQSRYRTAAPALARECQRLQDQYSCALGALERLNLLTVGIKRARDSWRIRCLKSER